MNRMKSMLLSTAAALLLTTGAAADTESSYDKDFQEMQKFINTMVDSHLTRAKIGNFGYPRVNVQSTKENYIYEFDLAGVAKKDIKLSIDENNVLRLSGKKESRKEDKSDKFIKQEIFYGSFNRVMQLPDDIDQTKIDTKYDNGILKLTIGRKAIKKPKAKILEIK